MSNSGLIAIRNIHVLIIQIEPVAREVFKGAPNWTF